MPSGELQWQHRVDRDGLVHLRWSSDNGANWERATVRTKTVGGRLTITELRLPDPTTTSIRRLRFGALEGYLRQQLTPRRDVRIEGVTARAHAGGKAGRVVLSRPDTFRLGDDFYRLFAVAYRDAVARGLAPRPTLASDAGVSQAAIARWAKEAKRKGYLTSAGAGKAMV